MPYLLDFLDSYDFGSGEEYEAHALIGASVLGNVFERLNAYKEGSFYTPSAITNYMCEQSITKVVVDKFNATFAWQCEDLNALRTRIDRDFDTKKQEFKDTLRSICICDPAVGSGHFLVATLNKMLKIYYDLGLCGSIQREEAHIIGDEFYSSDFTYTKPKSEAQESHKIQRELFVLKKSIIENNLFGVDINPNSVEICKLRLWIELLKSSYYLLQGDEGYDDKLNSHIHQMQTLPNIDINIKCGNSLISNFPLDSKLLKGQTLQFSRNLTQAITEYKTQVALYKESLGSKDEIEREIKSIKKLLKNYFIKQSQTTKNLEYNLQKFVENYGETFFDCGDDFCMEMSKIIKEKQNARGDKGGYAYRQSLTQPTHSNSKTLDKNGEKLLKQLQSDFKSLESLRNNDSFEWRFEFPEVLNENGDFMGFDLLVGNPPYMQVPKDVYPKEFFPYSEGKDKGKQNTYKVFVEQGYNLAKPSGEVCFITQSSIMCDGSATYTRELLLDNTQIYQFFEFPKNTQIFTGVTQGVCIMQFTKQKPHTNHNFKISIDSNLQSLKNPHFVEILQSNIKEMYPTRFEIPLIKDSSELAIINKLKTIKSTVKDFIVDSAQGNINTIHLKRIQSAQKTGIYLMKGENIQKYAFVGDFMNCVKTEETLRFLVKNSKFTIIAMQGITGTSDKHRIHCALLESKNTNQFVFLDSTKMLFVECKESAKYLVALLNSKLFNWLFRKTSTNNNINIYELESLPIPKLDSHNQNLADKIVNLVDKVLESKAQGKDSTTPLCHTERSEVSQRQTRDSSVASLPQNDKRCDRDFSHFANAQNDKIGEVNDKSAKVKNDKIENHNRDISPVAQYDKTNKSQYDTTDLESQIDDLVYQLYDLTHDEIQIIESK